jgi:uncharacterized protein DUF5522
MSLREGEDYYLERGLLVFTAAYHRRRGYCCGSGCRHCPYWPPHQGGTEPAADGLDASEREREPQPPVIHSPVSSDSSRPRRAEGRQQP